MIRGSFTADNIAERLRNYQHPDVDSTKTEVTVEMLGNKQSLLRVELYAKDDTNIIDGWYMSGKKRPGLLLLVNDFTRNIRVLGIYINKDYRGRGIGTDFIACLEGAAIDAKIKSMTLQPDDSNGVASYWQYKHGFITDANKPSIMRKRLD